MGCRDAASGSEGAAVTPTEAVKLVGIVRQLWPSMKVDQYTPDAWHMVLDDVSIEDALAAVRHLARSRSGYIQPADIRRRIAESVGLLPCSESEGLQAAAEVAGNRGSGASKLDPVTYRAYRAMGGPTAFDAPPSVIRPQWARVWADVTKSYEEELLAGDLGRAVESRRQLAIEAGES